MYLFLIARILSCLTNGSFLQPSNTLERLVDLNLGKKLMEFMMVTEQYVDSNADELEPLPPTHPSESFLFAAHALSSLTYIRTNSAKLYN